MLRLSKLTDYATLILSVLAKERPRLVAAMEISEITAVPLPTVSKILKSLLNAKLLTSVRGAKGGYSLARNPNEITVAEIIKVLEGPIALTECSLSVDKCNQSPGCGIRPNWNAINQAVYNALEGVTLVDLIQPVQNTTEIHIPVSNLWPRI